jgi:hypothetical protein
MVRAILDGRKSQTRRIIDPQPEFDGYWWSHKKYSANGEQGFREGMPLFGGCPYGTVKDQLWIREAWADGPSGCLYRADHHTGLERRDGDQKWKPSIHMKRVDSRITLEITNVRVERLNEISEEDAGAEGAGEIEVPGIEYGPFGDPVQPKNCSANDRDRFRHLWQTINGPDSWSLNPWVWVVEFRKI